MLMIIGKSMRLRLGIQGVNKETRSTQSQLRDAERQLKLDPGNAELFHPGA